MQSVSPTSSRLERDTTPLDIVEQQPDDSRPTLRISSKEQLRALLDALTCAGCGQRVFEPSQLVLEAGRINDAMYIVVDGLLEVRLGSVDGTPLAKVESGELVGEMSMVDDAPACAFVVALRPTVVVEVPRAQFWRLVEISHVFARALLDALSRRLRANNHEVANSARRNEELRRAATRDALTGVLNRRWLDAQLPVWATQQESSDKPFAFALLDIDHFKNFNDVYGHLAGDVVLSAVGAALSGCVRSSDAVVRYGGEEFAIALPGAPLQPAVAVLERMQRAVGKLECRAPDGTRLPRIHFSAGVVSVDRFEPSALLAGADALLYEAKRQGRNRVCGANRL